MFRVIVAGSRSIADKELVFQKLDYLLKNKPPQEVQIVSGTAKGVDQIGEDYARARGISCTRYPADWEAYGKRAGYIRNCTMAENADALVAFWDGKSPGTRHMIDTARSKGLLVRVIKINKTI